MSVKETDDQRERGNERGMKDKDRTGRKEREAERKNAKTCGREKKSERRRGGRKNRWKRERERKTWGSEKNGGNEDTFLGKERPFLVPIAT